MAQMQLRRLGPESWGERFRRAREASGLNMRQVEEILFPHVSKSGIVRLEKQQGPPTYRKDRGRASLLTILYGFDLEEADLPPAIDLKALAVRRRTVASLFDTSYPMAA